MDSTATDDWMGSSVDPPCFGQSKDLLCKCLTVTVDLQSHVSLKTPKSFSVEKPAGNSDYLLQFSFSLCERHFSGVKYSTFNMSSSLTFEGERVPAIYWPPFWKHGTGWVPWKCIETSHCSVWVLLSQAFLLVELFDWFFKNIFSVF